MTKILVIEDELTVRENLLELLEAEGFDAIGTENGRSGVQLAQESLPDLILCDVMMPELDGFGVLNAVRQNPLIAAVPFIFLTAKATKEDLRQGMNLGADDYLTKPFTRAELLSAIAARLKKQTTIADQYNTALKQTAERLNYLVHYDSLTNLPNRLLLRERLHQVLAKADYHNQLAAILCLNLDRFHRINETQGFTFGELLLQAVAERLTNCVSSNNTVARLNVDQFSILLNTIHHPQEAANIAQAILTTISEPFTLENQEIFITASVGIALYPQDHQDIDNLIKQANTAMYQATRQGGNNYQFYSPGMKVVSTDLLALEADLRHALEREEFQVYYQPQVDLKTGKIMGAEALVRWNHPERGLVSPGVFIPLAEETGLIIALGEWVLRTACAQTKMWQTNHCSSLQIAVNLSSYQFNEPNLTQKVAGILAELSFNPKLLELELTESIIVTNTEAAITTMNALRELGIQISIDDFGTGYSSLGYLQRFSFDTLKIDQCFVRNLTTDSKNTAIITAIIQMAHSLNLKVIAEGVETEIERDFLCQQECDAMQGYFFSRPIPAPDFERLLFSNSQMKIQLPQA
jgi:diguanylate cyclase (GGDEF)-like protein